MYCVGGGVFWNFVLVLVGFSRISISNSCMRNMAGIPDRYQSEAVLRNIAMKKDIMSFPKLLEESCQDPAPSKDFCHVMVTERGVIWRRWKVSVRNITQGAVPAPVERGFTVEEFLADKDMQGEVGRVMGNETLQRALRLLRGQKDLLSRLPEKVLFRIVSQLDLASIDSLSKVNRYLQHFCNSDPFWCKVYRVHHGPSSEEVRAVAADMGWKKVFFMDKIQLRKESSRRQRSAGKLAEASPSSSTFITQQQPEV